MRVYEQLFVEEFISLTRSDFFLVLSSRRKLKLLTHTSTWTRQLLFAKYYYGVALAVQIGLFQFYVDRTPKENSCRRVEYVLKIEGTVFPNTDQPRPANNVFIIFFRRVLCKQFLCWIFTAAIFKLVGIIKFIFAMIAVVIWIHNCLFLRSWFTFYVLCSEKKKLLEKTRKLQN